MSALEQKYYVTHGRQYKSNENIKWMLLKLMLKINTLNFCNICLSVTGIIELLK